MLHTPRSLFEAAERQFGFDAIDLSQTSSTTSILMVDAEGLPLLTGWFQNKNKPGAPGGGANQYALTSIPLNAKTLNHRLMIAQLPDVADRAVLKEEDCDGYLEGYDAEPRIIDCREIGQPALSNLIEVTTEKALVLDPERTMTYLDDAHCLGIDKIRERGLALRAQNAGLGYLEL